MDILKWATEIEDEVIAWRRKIYEHPELSDYEFETLALIRQVLTEASVTYVDVNGGGIMAFIEGDVPGKTVFLRADIDALPIEEDTCNWAQPKACLSKVPGVAHLCGHDAHTAMLMGAAKVLQAHKDLIEGRVILFFEQGEENGHGDVNMMKAAIQESNIVTTVSPSYAVEIHDPWFAHHLDGAVNNKDYGLLMQYLRCFFIFNVV